MKLDILQGKTSKRIVVFIQSSISTNGAGLTGLVNNSGGLTWYYWREDTGNAAGTIVNIVSATRGTFTSSGFIEIDATNLPGFYELGVPNAVLATGATWAVMMLQGAANMVPCPVEIQLTAYDPYNATTLGLTNLDATISSRSTYAGGAVASVTAPVTITAGQLFIKKNTALANFEFLMVSSTDHITPKTGLTITAQRSIDGGAFAACANAATELSAGIYVINLNASDLNGSVITFKFSGTGADTRYLTMVTQT